MGLSSGLGGYFGLKLETTWGTGVVPDLFLPLVSQSLTTGIDQQHLESAGILSGRRVMTVDQTEPGAKIITGDTTFELHSEVSEVLFELMFGTDTTTGAGPYTHTYSMGDLPSATLSVGVPQLNSPQTVHDFRFVGAMVSSWTLNATAGEYATLSISWVAKDVTVESALTPSYNADTGKFAFMNADFQHDTTSVCAETVTITGDNGLETDKICLNASVIDQPTEITHRSYELTADMRFITKDLYDDFIAGNTEVWDLDFAEPVADDTLAINGQGKITAGGGPVMSDAGPVRQQITSKLLASSSDDDDALEFILVNDTA